MLASQDFRAPVNHCILNQSHSNLKYNGSWRRWALQFSIDLMLILMMFVNLYSAPFELYALYLTKNCLSFAMFMKNVTISHWNCLIGTIYSTQARKRVGQLLSLLIFLRCILHIIYIVVYDLFSQNIYCNL